MHVQIIAVGKIKKEPIREAIAEYETRLTAQMKVEVTEVAPARLSSDPSQKEIQKAKEKEGEALLARASAGYKVALDQRGRMTDSESFARLLRDVRDFRGGRFVFFIGGSHGLSREVRKTADLVLSFSKMTFPHELFRLILIEQLYRGMKILQGAAYHK